MFTLLDREAIESLERAVAESPEGRAAQAALALAVTARVHGEADAHAARDASQIVFDRRADPRALGPQALLMLRDELPFATLQPVEGTPPAVADGRLSILDALVASGLAKSKGEARRQVQQGAVTVNGRRLGPEEHFVDRVEVLAGSYFLIRKGAREMALVELA
jgi:tyrosyl-tRNA synthetase